MSERPILFSGPMVRAILDGRKSQTRRIVKPQPAVLGWWNENSPSPYGVPGDRLWVRETWQPHGVAGHERDFPIRYSATHDGHERDFPIRYSATHDGRVMGHRWRSPIHMPRWASRLTLEVVSVRVERLQEIGAKDILAEGAVLRAHDDQFGHNPVSAFDGMVYMDLKSLWAAGWNSINAKRAPWRSNPLVWVTEFKRAP